MPNLSPLDEGGKGDVRALATHFVYDSKVELTLVTDPRRNSTTIPLHRGGADFFGRGRARILKQLHFRHAHAG